MFEILFCLTFFIKYSRTKFRKSSIFLNAFYFVFIILISKILRQYFTNHLLSILGINCAPGTQQTPTYCVLISKQLYNINVLKPRKFSHQLKIET